MVGQLYGLLIGVGQFGLLFLAIPEGFPVGLASLVIMAQAFFTILLAWVSLGERPRRAADFGAVVAFVGIAVDRQPRLAGASLGPFLMVILAAVFWGAGNVVGKTVGKVDMLAFVVWSSLAAPLPLVLPVDAVEGTGGLAALAHPSWRLASASLVLSYAGTIFGYGLWARLLAHYSAATVAPFALLVPVVGMVAGSLLFGEPLRPVELLGAVLVMAGLTFNVFGDRCARRWPSEVRSCTTSRLIRENPKASTTASARAGSRRAPNPLIALDEKRRAAIWRCRGRRSAATPPRRKSARRWRARTRSPPRR